jgi:hypothetical protein
MEADGLNDYFHFTQFVEDSQCKSFLQIWGVRGRLDSDNAEWFHIITLQRPSAGNCKQTLFQQRMRWKDKWKYGQLVAAERRRQ